MPFLSYGYYHYSGTASVVSTAKQTIASATAAKDKLVSASPSPKDALHLLRSLANPYVSAIPGGAAALDASFGQLEGLLEKHGDEVGEIVQKSMGDLKKAIGEGKEGGDKVVKDIEDMTARFAEVVQGQVGKVLEKNPRVEGGAGGKLRADSEARRDSVRRILFFSGLNGAVLIFPVLFVVVPKHGSSPRRRTLKRRRSSHPAASTPKPSRPSRSSSRRRQKLSPNSRRRAARTPGTPLGRALARRWRRCLT